MRKNSNWHDRDFEPNNLASLAERAQPGKPFEFPLQLPTDAPTDRPLELWVRLVPEDGQKLLARTTLDLSRNGRFASAESKVQKGKERPVRVAAASLPAKPLHATIRPSSVGRKPSSAIHQNGWETAKPGDVAKPAAAATAASEWKLATRPVPEAESTPIRSSTPSAAGGDRYDVAAAPDWTPERPADDETASPPEPAWSPTR